MFSRLFDSIQSFPRPIKSYQPFSEVWTYVLPPIDYLPRKHSPIVAVPLRDVPLAWRSQASLLFAKPKSPLTFVRDNSRIVQCSDKIFFYCNLEFDRFQILFIVLLFSALFLLPLPILLKRLSILLLLPPILLLGIPFLLLLPPSFLVS